MMKLGVWALLLAMAVPSLGRADGRTEVVVHGVTVTAKDLADKLGDYIAQEMAVKGGSIHIFDDALGRSIGLTPLRLDDGTHIHWLGGREFLSWGNFKDAEGRVYGLDFYLRLEDGRLTFSAPLTIYRVDKAKRYAWDESGDVMRKVGDAAKP